MRTGLLGAAVALLAAALAPAAHADVKRAESILPPGQSGFVSTTGLTSGTGSPHLYDQQPLYIDFMRKPAMFGQPGTTEEPRAGVRIVRDRFGIPAITAPSEPDAWFGAGYAVAQDRLFQLELFKRATSGRLSEIIGASMLEDDLIARRDYYTDAEVLEMVRRLPPNLQQRFADYRDGINAWIAEVRRDPSKMPGEFAAVGAPLVDWTVLDSARVGVFLARTVPSGDGGELDNLRAFRAIGARGLNALLPLRTPGAIPTVPRAGRPGRFPSQPGRTRAQERAGLDRSAQALREAALPGPAAAAASRAQVNPGLPGRLGGSYMFAVRRPGDRHAILFDGPQLGFSTPELFVEFEIHAPGLDVRGVTAPGVPLIGIGHNRRVAWGFTSGLSDEDDLYAEQLVPGQGERYRFDGAERGMDCREETFGFRPPPTALLGLTSGELPDTRSGQRTERICRTVHGPVQVRAGDTAYARRYAIWGRELETFVGLDILNRADTIADVDRAMSEVTWNENVIAADSQGNIGFWHPGLHPLRPREHDERLPFPGTGEAEWRGLLPRERTPRVINPRQGWLTSWNNIPSEGWTAGDGPARERLTGGYHRVDALNRLVRRLARNPTFEGAEGVIRRVGTLAQQRPVAKPRMVRARRAASGESREVLDVILRWDGDYHRTDDEGNVHPGVAAFEAFKEEAAELALAKLGAPAETALLDGGASENHAFDITNGEAYALRTLSPAEYRAAAAAAFRRLAARFETREVARWREPRKMYEQQIQGAGAPPPLPFFDRGTYEQIVEVGP